jgi:hypothetical protein
LVKAALELFDIFAVAVFATATTAVTLVAARLDDATQHID